VCSPPNYARIPGMDDPNQQPTGRGAPPDPERTQPHAPFPPPVARPGQPVQSVPDPPLPPPPEPPPRRRKRPRRKRRSCLGCLAQAGLVGALFAAAFTALLIVLYRVAPPPRTNVLVLGLDSRPGEGNVTRSDTMLLVTVDPADLYVGMLSIPRDLYVEIPGYGEQRINAAHVMGESATPGSGPALAAQTIEHNFGVPVHRTVRLNFEGFLAIIDAAGGVTIDVPEAFVDYEYPTPDYGTMVVSFEAGEQHMDGERALQYARIRHGSSDFERAARQQQVLTALVRQLLWPGNWPRWPGVYRAFRQHVESNLTILDMAAMLPTIIWTGPDGIDRRVIDREMVTGRTTSQGASVLEPDWARIQPVLDEMFFR
jgi:LCP family protein required for cell wall assembly